MSNIGAQRHNWSNSLLVVIAAIAIAMLFFFKRSEKRAQTALGQAAAVHGSFQRRLADAELDLSFFRELARSARLDSSVSLIGKTADTVEVSIALGSLSSPTMFYAIDTKCSTCLANLAFLSQLSQERSCDLHVEGVLLSPIEEYRGLNLPKPSWPVLHEVRGKALTTLPLSIPSTAVLIGKTAVM